MKMKYYILGLALVVVGLSACSQKEDITPSLVGQQINASFVVGGAQTRVNTLDEKAGKWENGDKIKAEVTGGGKTTESVLTATVSEDGFVSWSHHKNFVWSGWGQHQIRVSYPSDYAYDAKTNIWTLPIEQNSLNGLKSADYIAGSWKGEPWNYIKIPVAHCLALVTVEYEIGSADFTEGTTLENPVVISPYPEFSLGADDKVYGTGSAVEVKAYRHENANKFSAIVVPGTRDAGIEFLNFSVGGKNYKSSLKTQTEFWGGHRYAYNLKIGKDKVELTQIKVEGGLLAGWTNEEELK